MLFSYRRLRWSAISLLLICLLVLTPTTRRMLDQLLVNHILSPEVSVGILVFHGQKSIVEARDVSWTSRRGPRAVQLSAERGWIAVDKTGLIDRQVRFPLVILERAELQLAQAPPTDVGLLVHWKRRLAVQVSQLDWEIIQQPAGSLSASQSVRRGFAQRIERWLARSREILNEADALERESASMDNPLRFEISLKEKLARIRELSREQNLLAQQFDGLDDQLQSETKRLRELYQQDHLHFAGLVIDNAAAPVPHLEMDRLCFAVAQDLGQAFWQRIAPYGEVVDHLSKATHLPQRPNFDIDVRSDRFGNDRFAVNQWKGAGTFRCGPIESQFQASGDWRLTQEPFAPPTLNFAWEATFQHQLGQVMAWVEHNSLKSSASHLKLRHMPAALAKATPSTRGDVSETAAGNDLHQSFSEVNLISDSGQLRGQLALFSDTLLWLGADPVPELPANATSTQPQALQFELEGDWNQMQLKPTGTIPAWLAGALAAEANQRLQLAAAAQQSQLQREFETELAQLQLLVNTALEHAKSQSSEHERQLLATQQHLQRQIDQMDGLEYARRPGELVR
jgi:hypothetical protein